MTSIVENQRTTLQKTGLFLGPALFFIVLMLNLDPANPTVTRMAAVAALMAVLWVTEAVPLAATTQMILPILSSIAVAMKTNPLMLLIPATLSASCAFMMPVATPPNAIVFGSGRIKIFEMVKAGLYINIIGVVMITGIFLVLGTFVFSIDPTVIPDWALLARDK